MRTLSDMTYRLQTDLGLDQVKDRIRETFRKWGVRDYDIDLNVVGSRARNQSLSQQERAATIRFRKAEREVVLSLASQYRPIDNLHAIGLALEDMRMIDARGLSQVMESAYLQLAGPTKRDPYEALGIRSDAPQDVAEAAWRAAAKRVHPDAGGSAEAFQEVKEAWDTVKAQRGWA